MKENVKLVVRSQNMMVLDSTRLMYRRLLCKYSASCRDSGILTLGKKLMAGTEEALNETAAGLSLKPLLG